MPHYVLRRTLEALNDDGKPLRGSKLLVIGMAYKPNVDDVRETPAAEIITLLKDAGAVVAYHDPHVPVFPGMRKYDLEMTSTALKRRIPNAYSWTPSQWKRCGQRNTLRSLSL